MLVVATFTTSSCVCLPLLCMSRALPPSFRSPSLESIKYVIIIEGNPEAIPQVTISTVHNSSPPFVQILQLQLTASSYPYLPEPSPHRLTFVCLSRSSWLFSPDERGMVEPTVTLSLKELGRLKKVKVHNEADVIGPAIMSAPSLAVHPSVFNEVKRSPPSYTLPPSMVPLSAAKLHSPQSIPLSASNLTPPANQPSPTFTMLPTHMYAFAPSLNTAQPTRIKRRQVKNACTNCQKACKKCDDARPCLRCVRYGIAEECIDSQRKERKKGIKRGPYKKRDGKGMSSHRLHHLVVFSYRFIPYCEPTNSLTARAGTMVAQPDLSPSSALILSHSPAPHASNSPPTAAPYLVPLGPSPTYYPHYPAIPPKSLHTPYSHYFMPISHVAPPHGSHEQVYSPPPPPLYSTTFLAPYPSPYPHPQMVLQSRDTSPGPSYSFGSVFKPTIHNQPVHGEANQAHVQK